MAKKKATKKKASKKKVIKKVAKPVAAKKVEKPTKEQQEQTFLQKKRLYAEKQAADFRKRFPRN